MKDRLYTTTADIEKARALVKQGVLLAERMQGFHKLQLFQLPHFYLEVTWHRHFNVIVNVSRFTDTARLDPYLADVSLDALFA